MWARMQIRIQNFDKQKLEKIAAEICIKDVQATEEAC